LYDDQDGGWVNVSSGTGTPIEMLFELWTRMGLWKHVLDGFQIPPCRGSVFSGKWAAYGKA